MRRVRTALLVHSALGVESCALERSSLRAMKVDSVGQLIMTGVPGKELDAETARLFRRVQPGAFILFGRNLESATQLQKLIDDLRDLSDIKPIITIDQEGGCVSRLRRIGNEPPNAQQLRDKHDIDLIRRHSNIPGRLLRLLGSISIFVRCSTFPSMMTPKTHCAAGATEKMSNRLCAMPVRLMRPCASICTRSVPPWRTPEARTLRNPFSAVGLLGQTYLDFFEATPT